MLWQHICAYTCTRARQVITWPWCPGVTFQLGVKFTHLTSYLLHLQTNSHHRVHATTTSCSLLRNHLSGADVYKEGEGIWFGARQSSRCVATTRKVEPVPPFTFSSSMSRFGNANQETDASLASSVSAPVFLTHSLACAASLDHLWLSG